MFNSPWVGALAADLTRTDAESGPCLVRAGLAEPAPFRMPGDRYDEDIPAADDVAEADAWVARDRTVYRIGFKLLMGIAVAVGLSMAMVLRS